MSEFVTLYSIGNMAREDDTFKYIWEKYFQLKIQNVFYWMSLFSLKDSVGISWNLLVTSKKLL